MSSKAPPQKGTSVRLVLICKYSSQLSISAVYGGDSFNCAEPAQEDYHQNESITLRSLCPLKEVLQIGHRCIKRMSNIEIVRN
ncbi:hypothetical protein RUM43_011113 [Polyplax serrata]|uniref:Uncharacterized protein n=1 Tax=Polyplax serrata TaxID=468196 RepID=A0AAN8P8Q1_POLSC